jgi:hypothetical protein
MKKFSNYREDDHPIKPTKPGEDDSSNDEEADNE